jgi:abortive infection bacteriophage resistance protein
MCIIAMNGTEKKIKKLLLHISKADFMSRMIFDNQKEKERCERYLDLKGVSYHAVLANYIGLDESGKIEYKKVQNMYVYDKRIRYILYKFLSAFEEGIRGYIANHYNTIEKIKHLSSKIHTSVADGSSLSKELENFDFNALIQLAQKLQPNDLNILFNENENLDINLQAVRILRNTVSHHRMLFVYEDFGECVIDNAVSDTLTTNIVNLSRLINPFYRQFLIDSINNAQFDKDDDMFSESLPKYAKLHIEAE